MAKMATQIKKSNIECRTFSYPIGIEKREDDNPSRKIVGYAAKFNVWSSDLYGWFREKIDPKAFNNCLDQDTVALFNHNRDIVLARNTKTLKLSVDDIGLKYEFEAPNTTAGNDLIESLNRGDIKSSSFQFTVKKVEWSKSEKAGIDEDRTILEVENLIDVSPVTFPAYPDTDAKIAERNQQIAQRSLDDYCSEHRKEENEKDNFSFDIYEKELELHKL